MQKNAQIQEQDEPRVTRHIFVAMLIGFLGSSTGNLVLLVTTRDLLEIDLLVPTSFFMGTGLTLLTYKHILLSSGLCAFGAALLMFRNHVPVLYGLLQLAFLLTHHINICCQAYFVLHAWTRDHRDHSPHAACPRLCITRLCD
jgi:hypothetical protein